MVASIGFRNRAEAGRLLAQKLSEFAGRKDAVVLALPRGGLPVAYEVAVALDLPLDVLSVRKLGVPGHEELAMGAIASGGVYSLDEELISHLGLSSEDVLSVVRNEQRELERREHLYRDHREFPDVADRTVILVDDGVATGYSMAVAVKALRERGPRRIVVAAPVASRDARVELPEDVDLVCVMTPEPFYAVGLWFADFSQVSDEEVRELLARAALREDQP